MSVNSKMTAIADEIRTLSGTTAAMGLDAMATNVGDANTEVSSQSDLLEQIQSALEGKASGGSGDESVMAFTGTLSCTAPGGFTSTNTTFWYTDENMNAETFEATSGSDVPITIAKNTIVMHNSGISPCYGVEKMEFNVHGGAAYRVIADNFVISVM